MALKPIPGDLQGTIGNSETIQILPSPTNQAGSMVSIADVTYGTGPKPTISADLQSFTFTVLKGINYLIVKLASPDKVDGSALAQQVSGAKAIVLEDDIEFISGVAIWMPEVLGK